jgi:ABC-type sulfate transport system substrate-binding protein
MKKFISIAFLSVATLTASAQQATSVLQSYDVELVVFRTLNPNASPEEWGMEAAAARCLRTAKARRRE